MTTSGGGARPDRNDSGRRRVGPGPRTDPVRAGRRSSRRHAESATAQRTSERNRSANHRSKREARAAAAWPACLPAKLLLRTAWIQGSRLGQDCAQCTVTARATTLRLPQSAGCSETRRREATLRKLEEQESEFSCYRRDLFRSSARSMLAHHRVHTRCLIYYT